MKNKFLKRIYASFFGAFEVPILNYYYKKSKSKKHFFDKVEGLNKNFGWQTKIIPIKEAISSEIKILPTDEIREIIKRSRVRTVTECWCRKTFKNCKRKTNTCFVLFFAEYKNDLIKRGICSRVSEKKINQILNDAEREGLVHQLICCGDRDVFYVICNCCPCCCVGLQSLIRYEKNIVKKSDFVAEITSGCISCGKCVERCYFGAREIIKNKLIFYKDKCFGCGLCVKKCENKAIHLVYREL